MIYGSVCSGIEATTVAWHGLGWRPAWFAEIDPFACAVLAHRFPEVLNLGDFTSIRDHGLRHIGAAPIDLLVGGTPCQSFSVAGRRGGLEDARGNLAIEFCRVAGRLRPRWIVWENVPGVLSSNGGRDFGSILGTLAKLGYGCAWRVLDAQFFGVPQRRRRVFVLGHFGDWRPAAAVLFERESLCRDTPARRKTREAAATDSGCGAEVGPSGGRFRDVAPTRSHANAGAQVAVCVQECQTGIREYDTAATVRSDAPGTQPGGSLIRDRYAVRRWTPRECERLQGFEDDYTLVPYRGKLAADGPRYKAIGNSMAVPVMKWIGRRIDAVDRILREGACR
jgi:DNA (cytosine-5)-methyltransferase 1